MAVREFLYVDVDRSRSMLAQLDGGVVEGVVQKNKSAWKGGLAAKFLGFGLSGDRSSESGRDESRSLKDLTYVLFEEVAEGERLITDAPDSVRSADAWASGDLHAELDEGRIVKLACDLQVLDPAFFRARLTRAGTFLRAVAEMQVGSSPNLSKAQREKRVREQMARLLDNAEPEIITRLIEAVSPVLGDSIAVRAMPCGWEHPEFSFGGVLLNRVEYIQQEREDLFSRHGMLLRGWTIVMQLASIPEKIQGTSANLGSGTQALLNSDNQVQRAAFENMAAQLIGILESIGFSEGPRWPSITVTPLAIYREIPQLSGSSN